MAIKREGGSTRNSGQGDGGRYPGALDSMNRRTVPRETPAPGGYLGGVGSRNFRAEGLTMGSELTPGNRRLPRKE